MRIGYFADGPWSHNAFNLLIADKSLSIQFICVRNDTTDGTLKQLSKVHHIPYLKHENINSKEFIKDIKRYECELFVSMSFNQIFREEIINTPKYKTINCHAGKLPFYRGRNVLNWVLINDEKEFGITVHYVDNGIDTGDIILQNTYQITEQDNYKSLLEKSYIECAQVLYEAVKLIQSGEAPRIKQDSIHPYGFYCTRRKEGDELINWKDTSREIFNFTRAICSPGPMARSFVNGKEMKINRINFIENAPKYKGIEGSILKKDSDGFYVKTKDSFIKVAEFEINGKFRVGDRFEF